MYEFAGITKRIAATALLGASLVLAAGVAARAEPPAPPAGSVTDDLKIAADIPFSSPNEAFRQGHAAFTEGWYSLSLPALRYAADHGIFIAQLYIAKMYELGLGQARNDAEAFALYKRVADEHGDIDHDDRAAPYVGEAIAAVGFYYLNGIKESGLSRDIGLAVNNLNLAATYFRNARAQYELAKLYLSGDGVEKEAGQAIYWLKKAASKDFAPAQALLGQILWEGEVVPKQQLSALFWLTRAQENAAPQDSEWINGLYKTIIAGSQPQDISRAKVAVARWVQIYQPSNRRTRIIIQKEVRIGIAEDRSDEAADAAAVMGGPAAAKVDAGNRQREKRQWSGASSFEEIDRDIARPAQASVIGR
jgi:hypothetical protein